MGKITLILGGARSGKSSYAARLSGRKKVAFIATCEPLDDEMTRRIALHKKVRPKAWQTFEEPQKISSLMKKISKDFDIILLECLTLLVSNLLLARHGAGFIRDEIASILRMARKMGPRLIVVSNEVGLGIVPESKVGRDFRDLTGLMNQMVAKEADEVFFMVAGIPWRIK